MTAMTQELVDKVVELRKLTNKPALVCRKALAISEWDLKKAKALIEANRCDPFFLGVLVERRSIRG